MLTSSDGVAILKWMARWTLADPDAVGELALPRLDCVIVNNKRDTQSVNYDFCAWETICKDKTTERVSNRHSTIRWIKACRSAAGFLVRHCSDVSLGGMRSHGGVDGKEIGTAWCLVLRWYIKLEKPAGASGEINVIKKVEFMTAFLWWWCWWFCCKEI